VKSVAQRSLECGRDADLEATRVAALAQAAVALPALELHDALNRLTVDQDALASQLRPDHTVAQVTLPRR
jgi:hypothetical protein